MSDKPTLTVVPDVPPSVDEGVQPEFDIPEDGVMTPEKTAKLQGVLDEQNNTILTQLQLLSKPIPSPFALLRLQMGVLADFVFGEDTDARKQYEVACSMGLNVMLKTQLAKAMGLEVNE